MSTWIVIDNIIVVDLSLIVFYALLWHLLTCFLWLLTSLTVCSLHSKLTCSCWSHSIRSRLVLHRYKIRNWSDGCLICLTYNCSLIQVLKTICSKWGNILLWRSRLKVSIRSFKMYHSFCGNNLLLSHVGRLLNNLGCSYLGLVTICQYRLFKWRVLLKINTSKLYYGFPTSY
jgi:hypothetical protein